MPYEVIELSPQVPDTAGDRWMAVIFNNDTNSVDQVIDILIVATGCDEEEAFMEAWEAHNFGKAPVHFACYDECQAVCATLSTIGLKTEVCKEWKD